MSEELKSRRSIAKNEISHVDIEEVKSDLEIEQHRIQKKQDKKEELLQSDSYSFVAGVAKVMDTYHLDPILGLIPGGIGDAICSTLAIPFIYVSLFKVKSIPLTLAVIFNCLVDMCVGCIPFVGNIADFFVRGYRRNYKLIVGFVEDDKEVIHDVNRKAIWMAIFCVLLGWLLYKLIVLVGEVWDWFIGLF